MRAAVLRRTGITIDEIERPTPGPGQVLARVLANGLCGTDQHLINHRADPADLNYPGWGSLDLDRGVVLGHEWAVEIAATGDGVNGWVPGARAVGRSRIPHQNPARTDGFVSVGFSSLYPGAYGEYILLTANLLKPLPDTIPNHVAATIQPSGIARHAVTLAAVQQDEPVIIIGGGPIGLTVLLWLMREGVGPIAVIDPIATRRDLAESVGAVWATAPDDPNLVTRVNALDGRAPRLLFDCAGARGTIQSAMDLAARDARIIILGINGGVDELRPIVGIGKHLTLQFSQGYNETDELETIAAFADGSMDTSPIITRTLSLDELPDYLLHADQTKDCKAVLTFSDTEPAT